MIVSSSFLSVYFWGILPRRGRIRKLRHGRIRVYGMDAVAHCGTAPPISLSFNDCRYTPMNSPAIQAMVSFL